MTDTFEFTLDHPLTEEQWDMLTDVDLDHTDRIWFNTKHGKEVEFAKVTRCKDCKYYTGRWCAYLSTKQFDIKDICKADDDFCSMAERREK